MQVVSAKDETVRLFQSDFMERFSRVHWSVPLWLYLPAIAYFLVRMVQNPTAGVLVLSATFFAGLGFWSLLEYLMHRLFFHFEPRRPWARRFFYIVHGIHHAYPSDSKRLVMPPVLSLPMAFLFYFLFSALLPPAGFPPFFIGIGVGYLSYDMVHYSTHHLPMRGRIGKFLKHYHLRHHFNQDARGFGVSSPLWDRVFGTYPSS